MKSLRCQAKCRRLRQVSHRLNRCSGAAMLTTRLAKVAGAATTRKGSAESSESFSLAHAPTPVGAYVHSRKAGGLLFVAGMFVDGYFLCDFL